MIISKKSLTIFLLVLPLLTACDSSEKAAKTARVIPAQQVEVITAALQQISHQQTITGSLEAATIVHLYNEVTGRITELPFHEGDRVSRGTAMVKIDDDLIEAELQKAVALKKQARLDLDRLKKLIQKKLASEEDLTRAGTALEIATAEEKLQHTRLSKTIIQAPFSGVITERNYEPGDVVPLHSHILTLINPASLHLKMQLSESWLPFIEQNSPVEVTIDALGNAVNTGKISRIHPTIDPNTRKGIVEVELTPVPDGAKAGQLARVKFSSTARDRLLAPSHAVRHDSRGAYLFVIDQDNKAVKTYIVKGLQFGDQMEIKQGLQINQHIVTKGFTGLRDGIQVEIIAQNTTTP